MILIKGNNVLIHVITLTFMCLPPVFHTYRGAADCHSHCFITPPTPQSVSVSHPAAAAAAALTLQAIIQLQTAHSFLSTAG